MKHQSFLTWCHQNLFQKRMRGSVGFVPQGVNKTSDDCFVSHSRWANAFTHDHFQRKKKDLTILFRIKSWSYIPIKFAALVHRIQIKCGIVPFSNSVWEMHFTICRPMMLMKLMIILLNCTINILF